MATLKAPKHKSYLRLSTRDKYVVQFTGPTFKTHWYSKRTELIFLKMPVLNSIQ